MDQINFKQLIEANKMTFYQDLATLIEIPSVKGPAEEGAPYGIENKRVLEQIMKLAYSYGFSGEIVDDAVAYIQVGNDADYIGIAGHLDVVAAGGAWNYPPFELTIENGKLYGRGILDNKGPIFSCLFGLKLLMDQGYQLKQTLRILFGSDEESGSADIARYLAHEAAPRFAFTPDCKYPVVYGERGILNVVYETPLSPEALALISEISGEQDRSFVPDVLSCQLEGRTYAVSGKRAPSNAPELGNNAITLLAKELAKATTNQELKNYFQWLEDAFHDQHFGQGIDMAWSDEMSGILNITPYLLEKTGAGFKLGLSLRYPVSYTEETVLDGLQKAAYQDSTLTLVRSMPSLLTDKNRPEVAQLSKAYADVTALDSTPVTTTGATYARALPNTVAFGPSFPGQKGIAHNADEYMDESDLLLNMEIYMHAILNLCEN